jgi:amino acid transporter
MDERKEIDPQLELMLEEAAKDAARLRKQMAKVTLASGVVLAVVGAGLAVSSLVNLLGAEKTADAGLTAGFTATALLFALVLFGVGLWFVIKGLND